MYKEVTRDIYLLNVPMPYNMGFANSYLIKGRNGYTIIDTGDNTEDAKDLWKKVLSSGLGIEKIVLTHAHPDHIGLAGWFQREKNIPIWMSRKGYEELLRVRTLFKDKKYVNENSLKLIQLHGGLNHEDHSVDYYKYETYEFEPTRLFEEPEHILLGDDKYETIWTPGHSPDHYCFYNKEKQIMIVGDHILKAINPVLVPEIDGSNPLKDYLYSLDKLNHYSTNYVLTGHGEILYNLSSRVEQMKKHHKHRMDKIIHLIDDNGSTAYEIAQKLYADRSTMSSLMQTITYLIYMESIHQIKMKTIDKKVYFYNEK